MIGNAHEMWPAVLRYAIFSSFLCVADGGCREARIHSEQTGPILEFTSVPVAGPDDPKQVSAIKGELA